MAIQVPVDVDVTGLSALEVLDEHLDDIADPRVGKVGLDTSQAVAAAAALDKLLDAATEERDVDVNVDVDGLQNLDRLRKSLNVSKERAEILALEKALDAVAKLREANVDVEVDGLKELAALDKALNAVERRRTVEVDVDHDVLQRAVGSATKSSSAISEAFSGAFQLIAKNAILLVGVVGAAMAALPVIGAAVGTALVLAFGGAIAGFGILAAAQSEKVQQAFGSMADNIVKDMKRIAAPLEGTLIAVAGDITEAFENMLPTFEKVFEQMSKSLTVFSDQFFDAFQNLEPAVQPLTDAFEDLLQHIGPRLDGFFTNVSDSVTRLSKVISADPDLFAGLFVGILNLLPGLINLITDLAEAFQVISDIIKGSLSPAFADFKEAIEPLTSAFSDATGGMSLFQFGLSILATTVGAVALALAGAFRIATTTINLFKAAGAAIAATWENTKIVTQNAWNAVRKTVSSAIANVRGVVSRGMSGVRGVFSSAWAAVRGVVSRALAAIRGSVTGGMNAVRNAVNNAMARVRGVFSSAWAAIRGVVSRGISAVRSVISSGLSSAVGAANNAWSRIRSAFSRGVSGALGIVRRLPGAILGVFSGLGGALFSSGYSMISGLARGITAGFGAAISAASSGLSRLRSFFPFSPAKRGPFSGTGYTTYSGKALVEDFADSISKTASQVSPEVASALDPLANAFTAPDVSGRPVSSPQGSSGTGAQPATTDALVAALASLFARMKFDISLGLDRRTTATLWLDGQRLAEVLQ
jgi:phage-related protein